MQQTRTQLKPLAMDISHTRLSTWLDCPKKYQFSYVLEAEEEGTSVHLVFGSAIHEAVGAFFESLKKDDPLVRDEVHGVFERAFADEVFVAETMDCPMEWGDTDFEQMVEKGRKMLDCFLTKVDRKLEVLHTEYYFETDVGDGSILRGYMDCIVRTGKNRYKIIEIKTAKRAYTQDRLAYDLQPTCYIWALKALFPDAEEIEFEYWLLMKTKEPDLKVFPVNRNESDLRELAETISEFLKAIRTEAYPRRRGWLCDYCGFSQRCREGTNGDDNSAAPAVIHC